MYIYIIIHTRTRARAGAQARVCTRTYVTANTASDAVGVSSRFRMLINNLLFFSIHDSFKILLNKHSSNLSLIVAVTLVCYFPYIFQRMTLWDSVMFSWLFMPVLFNYNRKIYKD